MKYDDLLASLKARFASQRVSKVIVGADETTGWPELVFERLLAEGILVAAEPAQSLECRGCERQCPMPVQILSAEGGRPARAFIACDKPENFGRIPVPFARLRQWQMTRDRFEALHKGWLASLGKDGRPRLVRSKAPEAFRSALEKLLIEIGHRARAAGQPFDRDAMPGRKVDLQALADKFDSALEHQPRTFDDYLDGLCRFKRGARKSTFYADLFPEYFK